MSEQTVYTAVRITIEVGTSCEHAFDTFTRDIASWWPRDHHLVRGDVVEMTFEPRVGGHIVERNGQGEECRWARVLVWDPPARVVFTWDIDTRWQLESDPARTSEVEVRFIAESATRTRVELEHRNIERHGADWTQMRDGVSGPNGWPVILELFAQRLR